MSHSFYLWMQRYEILGQSGRVMTCTQINKEQLAFENISHIGFYLSIR
jgi:hypothetical protein